MATFAERIRKRIDWHQERVAQLRLVLDARRGPEREERRPTARRGREGDEEQPQEQAPPPPSPEQQALDAHQGAIEQLEQLVRSQPAQQRETRRLQPQQVGRPRRRGNFVTKI